MNAQPFDLLSALRAFAQHGANCSWAGRQLDGPIVEFEIHQGLPTNRRETPRPPCTCGLARLDAKLDAYESTLKLSQENGQRAVLAEKLKWENEIIRLNTEIKTLRSSLAATEKANEDTRRLNVGLLERIGVLMARATALRAQLSICARDADQMLDT
jgi:hypothetical protein